MLSPTHRSTITGQLVRAYFDRADLVEYWTLDGWQYFDRPEAFHAEMVPVRKDTDR